MTEETLIVATNSFDSTRDAIREYFQLRARNGYTRRMKIHREQKHILDFFAIPKTSIVLFGKKRETAVCEANAKEISQLKIFAEGLFENLSICKEESPLLNDKNPKEKFVQVTDECGGWSDTHGGWFKIRKDYWFKHNLEKDQIIEAPVIETKTEKKKSFFARIFSKWW